MRRCPHAARRRRRLPSRLHNAPMGLLKTALTLLSALSLGASCASSEAPRHPYLGTWIVTEHRAGKISAMTEAECDAWLGRELVLTEESATFDGVEIPDVDYQVVSETIADLFSRWPDGPSTLELAGETVSILTLTKAATPARSLWLAGENRLLTQWDGIFFVLERGR